MSPSSFQESVGNRKKKSIVTSSVHPSTAGEEAQQKLRIYAVIQALKRGCLPDNMQLDDALVYMQDSLLIEGQKGSAQLTESRDQETVTTLSEEGRTVALDIRDIVEAVRQLLKQKNADEILQNFIHHTSEIKFSASRPGIEMPLSKAEARKDGETAVRHLRTLLRLLITNREARKLVRDSKFILRDLFAQTAVAIAERTRPSAREMHRVDDAALAEDWIGSVEDKEEEEGSGGELIEHNPGNSGESKSGRRDNHTEDSVKARRVNVSPPGTDQEVNDGFKLDSAKKAPYWNLKERLHASTDRIPEKYRTHVKEEYVGAKEYLQEEFPQARRDHFVWRLEKVVTECQATESYQASISWLLTLLHTYFTSARALAESHASQTNDLFLGDPILGRVMNELRMIAERCAGEMSLDGVLGAVDVLWNDAQDDADMRKWWENVEEFVRKILLQPGYITSSKLASQSRRLRTRGRYFFTQKYKAHTDSLIDAAQTWVRAWLEDPLNARLADGWSKLIRDLLFDDNGRLVFKSPLWKDMRTVVLPALMHKISIIPIPRIEYVDDDLDLVIENLILQGENLFPKLIEVKAEHYSKFLPFTSANDEHHNSFTLTLGEIQANMHDVAFYFRRKRGFGKISDKGLADVSAGGRGITIRIQLTTANTESQRDKRNSVFTVKDVHVKIAELRFAIRESKHDFLYKTLRPIATRLIKNQIAKVFSDGIRIALEYVDEHLTAAREGMAKAESTGSSKQQVLKKLWQKPVSEHSSGKSRLNSTFRIVPKRDSMLLPDKGYQKGWIRGKSEANTKPPEEEGWKSEVFNMRHTTRACN